MSSTDNSETEKKDDSLLTRLGGSSALQAVVESFYFRILCDADLLVFFDGVDNDLLKAHQHKFLTLAFTVIPKGVNVTDKITKAHSRLWAMGLSELHFDKVASHLVDTLLELGIEQPLIDEVVAIVGPLRLVFQQNAIVIDPASIVPQQPEPRQQYQSQTVAPGTAKAETTTNSEATKTDCGSSSSNRSRSQIEVVDNNKKSKTQTKKKRFAFWFKMFKNH